jgi:hypothetical protein
MASQLYIYHQILQIEFSNENPITWPLAYLLHLTAVRELITAMQPYINHPNNRLGFYYYPDTYHYQDHNLKYWVPELKSLGAGWLVLRAPIDRAIPEGFIKGLLNAGINPILHFLLSTKNIPPARELELLFTIYARWGVKYTVLFDRPNTRSTWTPANWAQTDLVERFLDIYLPIAETSRQAGLIPVFPPLEPGGDYWDTAFLRAALQGIQRRGYTHLLDQLVLGVYAWFDQPDLNWGAGGPERWPDARPYFTPPGHQDQLGFRIFDWYRAVSLAVLRKACPMIIIAAGARQQPSSLTHSVMEELYARHIETIAHLLAQHPQNIDPIPDEILACNFWLLTASPESLELNQCWYKPDGSTRPAVGVLRHWTVGNPFQEVQVEEADKNQSKQVRSIQHYVLLPIFDWGVSDWHLEVIRPFVKKHRPTIGFSIAEAALADQVTIIGGPQYFPDSVVSELAAAGCQVKRIDENGTSIATYLSSL